MKELISGIFTGILSGDAAMVSQGFFNFTVVMYAHAMVFYLIYLAVRKKSFWLGGFVTAITGCVAETFALGFRWYAGGWDHPPFTNMYESLVFFAWGIVVTYLFFEYKSKVRIAGAMIMPFAFFAMGLASLNPDKGISPLVPALQSIWLHIHVFSASIGYAAFLVAFAISVLYLLKDIYPVDKMFVGLSVVNVLGLLAVTKGRALFMQFPVSAAQQMGDTVRKIYIQGTDPPQFEMVNVPMVGILAFLSIAVFVAASLAISLYNNSESGRSHGKGTTLFYISVGVLTLTLVAYIHQSFTNPEVSIKVNPYSFALVSCIWLFSALLVVFNKYHDKLTDMLPEARKLDEMSYKAIMVAFPIMTLILVTGAVWANNAWGRYWGWDPKETASLITWIIYLLYLHTRFTKGWAGRRTAFISIIGFISVLFTYLGVNLLMSGLHAYASG